MNNKMEHFKNLTRRENFLISALYKVMREYKALLEHSRRSKPLKIVEILSISSVPGDSVFTIQVTHKNCIARLSAAEIINAGYKLNEFSDFHAEMISQAAQGKLAEFLKLSEIEPVYKITSKKINSTTQQCAFTIETRNNIRFTRTAAELSCSKNILSNMSKQDVYDIGYTQGYESVVNEKKSFNHNKCSYIHEKS